MSLYIFGARLRFSNREPEYRMAKPGDLAKLREYLEHPRADMLVIEALHGGAKVEVERKPDESLGDIVAFCEDELRRSDELCISWDHEWQEATARSGIAELARQLESEGGR